jgi:hypothetical protein
MPLPPALARLVADLNTAAQKYDSKNTANTDYLSPYTSEARDLSKIAEELADLLKPMEERIWTLIFGPSALVCVNVAFNCGLFSPWPHPEMSSKDLSVLTKTDEKLISSSSLEVRDIC